MGTSVQKVRYVLAGALAAMLGILMNPEQIAASHSVRVTGLDELRMVETRISPIEKNEFSLAPEWVPEIVAVVNEASVQEATEPVADMAETVAPESPEQRQDSATVASPSRQMTSQPQTNSLQILGNTIELRWTDVTTEDAGTAVLGWYYNSGKFIYAHNHGQVLGVLNAAYDRGVLVGTRFNVTMDGVTRYYTVTSAKVYTANAASWKMRSFADGGGHTLALMTCYGEGRLVVFAD